MDYIIYFVITIAILVFVHEFGHFAAAKLSKMRADVFAIGFGKRLFGWNKINGFTFGDLPEDFDGQGHTDYRLCLLPLGGYVKIAGMVDESFDTEFAEEEPKPWEFRAKPTYKKIFVITAGVMMNLTLTFLIFWGMNFFQGKQVIQSTTIGTVADTTLAAEAGFQTGDEVIRVNNIEVDDWQELLTNLLVNNIGNDVNVVVLRDGNTVSFTIPKVIIGEAAQKPYFLNHGQVKPYISEVVEDSPAEAAGIQAGDMLLKLNGKELVNSQQAIDIYTSNREAELPLVILRGEDTVTTTIAPGEDGKVGTYMGDIYSGPVEYKAFGFFESIGLSISNIIQYTDLTLTMLKNVITGEVAFNQVFGGPVKIAQFAAKSADTGISSFLFFLAMLSLSLAIINILPFPVLDGGHFVIILIEGIIRRELPIKLKIAIQNAGFVLLLMLMAFIIYSDIISL